MDGDGLVVSAAAATVLLGALVQRVSGLGFALISAPLLVLAVGPVTGVELTNLLAVLVSVSVLATSWRDVDLHQARLLVPSGVVGVLPGIAAARLLSPGPLQVAIGALVVLGLLATMLTGTGRARPTTAAALGTGTASGFMNAVAGVGGPALTVYALATGWSQESFAATAQVSFAVQSTTALAIRGLPDLPTAQLVTVAAMATAGLVAGELLARRLSRERARTVVVVLAVLGGIATMIRGALT
jgi:uncharacterized membrane protein YfcA